jgi:hypothetical protein
MGIMSLLSGRIGLALSAAERGNAGKRPERLDSGISMWAVSFVVPPTYNTYMLLPTMR